jgi:ceramide synthetase
VGSLVLLAHDFADHWLELAKLARYVKYQTVCDVAFGMFATTWVYTRLSVYPTWIIYSTSMEAGQILAMFPAYYVFNFLLTTLLILHLFWGYFIIKVAYKVLMVSEAVTDTRSHSESSSE